MAYQTSLVTASPDRKVQRRRHFCKNPAAWTHTSAEWVVAEWETFSGGEKNAQDPPGQMMTIAKCISLCGEQLMVSPTGAAQDFIFLRPLLAAAGSLCFGEGEERASGSFPFLRWLGAAREEQQWKHQHITQAYVLGFKHKCLIFDRCFFCITSLSVCHCVGSRF